MEGGFDSRNRRERLFVFYPCSRRTWAWVFNGQKARQTSRETISKNYELEDQENELGIQKNQDIGDRTVVVIDDLLATGGTVRCAKELLESQGAKVVGCIFVVELLSLNGYKEIDWPVFSLKKYD